MTQYDRYLELWMGCEIRMERIDEVEKIVDSINKNMDRYKCVEDHVRTPWCVIAAIHNMESSLSFERHLHNGDPLTDRTKHVPVGRPIEPSPPFTWETSAVDAMFFTGMTNLLSAPIEQLLYRLEKYNGMGYKKRGVNSPYLWAATNKYGSAEHKGKFVSDGKFDPKAISKQVGVAAILRHYYT